MIQRRLLSKTVLEAGAIFLERSGYLRWTLERPVTLELVEDLVLRLVEASEDEAAQANNRVVSVGPSEPPEQGIAP